MPKRDYFRYDDPSVRKPFWLEDRGTKGLLLLLAGIHLFRVILAAAAPGAARFLDEQFALSARDVFGKLKVWQLLTCALLHGDSLHLLFNCLFLWFFGRIVERRLGFRRFLWFFAIASLFAAVGYVGWTLVTGASGWMVGASGALMGMVVLAAFWTPFETIYLFGLFGMPLWFFACLVVALDLVQMLESPGAIAHTAHLAGAAYGWIYYKLGGRIDRLGEVFDFSRPERRLAKQRRRMEEERELKAVVDAILDKVNREGMAALTPKERRLLKKASARLRDAAD